MRSAAVLILLLGLGAFAWSRWMAARERAVTVCRRACVERDLQLLDETVCLIGVRLRLRGPRPALTRTYGFEYSTTGNERSTGRVTLAPGEPPQVAFLETDRPAT